MVHAVRLFNDVIISFISIISVVVRVVNFPEISY